EGTRKKEEEVVKELDQILERLRQARMQQQKGQGKRQQQAGNQQGEQQDQNNPDAKGVGEQKPDKPTVKGLLAGQKDTWGDLPPALREEMENMFSADMLPAKRDMIIRYYKAVAKKGRAAPGR